jgi:glutathione S-transferase
MYVDKQFITSNHDPQHIFNCAQRGHQNTLENYGIFLCLLTLSSIHSPFYGGCFGLVYLLGIEY